jgi:hypothetical protein
MDFINLSFADDLAQAAFSAISDKSVLIFPTRASADSARLEYQDQWALEDLLWISMQDFKDLLLCMQSPVLEDDKRLICLYRVLSDEDKEHFHINGYTDLVLWGTQLFQFCSELCEAGIAVLHFQEQAARVNLNLRLWQEDNILRISEILLRYREFIARHGFSDRIFHAGVDEAQIPFFGYRIISVNQFYYSNLEKALLKQCENAGNRIILIYQGVQADEQNWETGSFDPAAEWAGLSRKPQIRLYECESEIQQALSFIALDIPQCAILDSQFGQKAYSAYFDPAKVIFTDHLPITETHWCRFQRVFLEILQSLEDSPGYIPLRLIIKYFGQSPMLLPLCPAWTAQDLAAFEQELFELHNREVLYLDTEPARQFDDEEKRLFQFAVSLNAVLQQITQIRDIGDLADLLSTSLAPERFSTAVERENTDLLPRVWTAMANFSAIQDLGLISSWTDLFDIPHLGLFELWLDYLKSISLKRDMATESQSLWEISNLLDARNRVFPRVVSFNLVEGILPAAPSPIWLLNEHQRKILGLKTYDDIREWERYYFFRLVFCAEEVLLFSYLDAEKAIDHSSFIGELQSFTDLKPWAVRVDELGVLQNWQAQKPDPPKLSVDSGVYHSPLDPAFFRLPCDPPRDFGEDRAIRCGSYDLSLFAYNPFVWYISSLRRISPRRIQRKELISPTLFGTLLHAYFAEVLGEQASKHSDATSLDAVFADTGKLKATLLALINSPKFRYKMPKNYNADYLSSIICDCLAMSLKEFYQRFLRRIWSDTPFTLIPEEERMSEAEKKGKILLRHSFAGQEYRIRIAGKADLRIESSGSKYIVDFKTGRAKAEQLIFYEWLYYLLDNPESEPELKSLIWMILQMRIDDKTQTSSKKRGSYLENIAEALSACLTQGYRLAGKSTDRLVLRDVSRSDLYLPGVHHEAL